MFGARVEPTIMILFIEGGGAGRSPGSGSADPQGPGIWFIFRVFRMKIKNEGLLGKSLEN